MEVDEDTYREFYKTKRRQKYLEERSVKNGDFSYDMLTTNDFNGEDILVDEMADTCEKAVSRIMLGRLRQALLLLAEDEQRFILEFSTKNDQSGRLQRNMEFRRQQYISAKIEF